MRFGMTILQGKEEQHKFVFKLTLIKTKGLRLSAKASHKK